MSHVSNLVVPIADPNSTGACFGMRRTEPQLYGHSRTGSADACKWNERPGSGGMHLLPGTPDQGIRPGKAGQMEEASM